MRSSQVFNNLVKFLFKFNSFLFLGTTSSISHELLGFDCAGNVINYKFNEMMTSEEICDKSSKLISFIDLAGSKKYFKTTILGNFKNIKLN